MSELDKLFENAIWSAKELFNRGKVSGSSANLSFKWNEKIYVTGTNTSFGRLTKNDFSILSLDGTVFNEVNPSKEYPLHLAMYKNDVSLNAVIHTHSTYATYWSCVNKEHSEKLIPSPTPYLKMKVGNIQFVPYANPGSQELFSLFEKELNDSTCYLLQNHGPILGDKSILNAFYAIEELEEAAKNAWLISSDL